MSMTSYERVMTALDHRRPDRPPLNYYGTAETDQKLLAHLQLNTREELLRHLGADMRYVGPQYIGPHNFSGMHGYHTGSTDMWGIGWKAVSNNYSTYYESVHHPLAHARTVTQIEDYPWPRADWLSVDHLPDAISQINRAERRAVVWATGEFLDIACGLRGLEQFLVDMIECPEIADSILARVVGLCREVTMRAVEQADGGIDIIWSGGDVGMQTGMLFSPDLWRRQIKPFHKRLIDPFKKMGLKIRYHTDGSVVPIIPDLIDMGLDLLDPIQPNTPGMDPENLNWRFGGKLSFYGGVDTQRLLPYGTPQEVEQEVLHLIEVLGAHGGYVVAACNAVQADVPIENILTLYRTAREYRY